MSAYEIISVLILIATIAAIILGPIVAVRITRDLDDKRERHSRRLDVFRDLMKTRQVRLDPVHVAALNLVEVEFYSSSSVRSAYAAYIRHLRSPNPSPEQQGRYFDERDDLFIDLLKEIAAELGYEFDKRELSRMGYAPQGWGDDQFIQRKNALLLSQILEGERPLPIAPHVGGSKSPYPPAPSIEEKEPE